MCGIEQGLQQIGAAPGTATILRRTTPRTIDYARIELHNTLDCPWHHQRESARRQKVHRDRLRLGQFASNHYPKRWVGVLGVRDEAPKGYVHRSDRARVVLIGNWRKTTELVYGPPLFLKRKRQTEVCWN